MDWKERLISEARAKGMCAEFYFELSRCNDKITAIELLLRNPTWAIRNDYPSFETLMDEFQHYGQEGLFVNHYFTGEVLDSRSAYVLYNCTGNLYVDFNIEKRNIPTLYVSGGCDIVITANDSPHSIVTEIPVKLFGENTVRTVGTKFIIPKMSRL